MDARQKLVKKVASKSAPSSKRSLSVPFVPTGKPIKAASEDSLGPQKTAKLVNRGYTYSNGYWRQTKPPFRPKRPKNPSGRRPKRPSNRYPAYFTPPKLPS
jgi:hypothetical protein